MECGGESSLGGLAMSSINNVIAASLIQTSVQQAAAARERDALKNENRRAELRKAEQAENSIHLVEDSFETDMEHLRVIEDEEKRRKSEPEARPQKGPQERPPLDVTACGGGRGGGSTFHFFSGPRFQ